MGSKIGNFLRQFTGGKQGETANQELGDAETYKGYTIRAAPIEEGSQWRTAGIISKEFDDGMKEHRFIRADVYGNAEDARTYSIAKAHRIIDEQGDRIFWNS